MKKRFERILGVLTVVLGMGVISVTLVLHFDYTDKMNNLLENRIVLIPTSTPILENSDNSNNDSVEDFTIEVLDEDQKVAEIKDGTPVISIPSLDIIVPVVNGTDEESLRIGAGKFDNSVNMGQVGNFCVAGHSSTIYNCIFNDLEKIELLDVIECYNSKGVLYKYYVTDTFKTNSENTSVTLSSNEKTMTIVTCTDGGIRRFIVIAKLMTDDELYNYKLNMKQSLVYKAINISDTYSDIDISSYFKDDKPITRIPYFIRYCNVEKVDSFFTNYILSRDKLKVRQHILDVDFSQPIGFDFSSIIKEDGGLSYDL